MIRTMFCIVVAGVTVLFSAWRTAASGRDIYQSLQVLTAMCAVFCVVHLASKEDAK